MSIRDRSDFAIVLPIDPLGARDPAIVEQFPEHAKLIGFIVAEWSHVEYKIVSLLAIGLGLTMQAATAMVHGVESGRARLDMVRAAIPYMRFSLDSAPTELAAILDDARSLLTQRNKFAHGFYGETAIGEMAFISLKDDGATDLPLHDLTHQFGRMKALSFRVGRLIAMLAGLYAEQPSEQHASHVLQLIERDLDNLRIHPSPPTRPESSQE